MTTSVNETDRRDNNLLGRLIGLLILIALYLIVSVFLRPSSTPAVSPPAATPTRVSPTNTPPASTPTAAPAVTLPTIETPAAELKAGPLTLMGTGASGSKMQIVIDGKVAGEATVGADGRWSFPITLTAGTHTVVVNTLDAAGGVAASAPELSFEVKEAFAVPMLDPLPSGAVAGPITLTGTGTPGLKVQILLDGKVIGEVTVGTDGKWSFPTMLAAGSYRLAAQALDLKGVIAAMSEPLNVTLATAAVSAPTLDIPVGTLFVGPVTLTGAGTPGAKVQVVIGGQPVGEAIVGADGKWSFQVTLPKAGVIPVVVNALDASGQVAASSPATDLTVTALSLDPPTASYRPGPATFTGRSAPGSRVQLIINGRLIGETTVGADGRWTINANFARAGDYAVAVSVLDANGQVVATSAPVNVHVQAVVATPVPSVICDYNDPTIHGEDMGTYWLVDRCDTMTYIAQQTGIPLNVLIVANPQIRDPNLILPGWRVNLPGR